MAALNSPARVNRHGPVSRRCTIYTLYSKFVARHYRVSRLAIFLRDSSQNDDILLHAACAANAAK